MNTHAHKYILYIYIYIYIYIFTTTQLFRFYELYKSHVTVKYNDKHQRSTNTICGPSLI